MENHINKEKQQWQSVTPEENTVTPESFDLAVEALISKGLTLSVRNLRKELGCGSHSTLTRMLRQYNRKVSIAELSKSMPEKFAEDILKLGTSMFEYLQKDTVSQRLRLQNEYDERHYEISQKCQEMENNMQSMQKELADLRKANCDLKKELDAERKLNHSLQEQLFLKLSEKSAKRQ